MGIIPLQYEDGQTADTLGLTGQESFSIAMPEDSADLKPRMRIEVTASSGKSFFTVLRFDTEPELTYYRDGYTINVNPLNIRWIRTGSL